MVVAELLGWFGAALSCVISLPQVVRTLRAKRLDGISSATYWLVLANAAAWTVWSLLTVSVLYQRFGFRRARVAT